MTTLRQHRDSIIRAVMTAIDSCIEQEETGDAQGLDFETVECIIRCSGRTADGSEREVTSIPILNLKEMVEPPDSVAPDESKYDDEMKRKVDGPASRMKQFFWGPDFQKEFDAWAADVEQAGNGELEITHEEPIVNAGNTMGFMIWYRIAPRPSHGLGRGRRP
jgi:hypothetical protein